MEMPISHPKPNSPPSVNRVDALTYTAALSTLAVKYRSASGLLGHDGLAVAGGVRRDVGDRLLHILHALDGKNVIQKFRIKILLPRLIPGDDGSRRLDPAAAPLPFPGQ